MVWALATVVWICPGCSDPDPDAERADDASGADHVADVGLDPCRDATDLNARDYAPDEDWTIRSAEDALVLRDARSVTGGVVFDGLDLVELSEFSCLERVDALWIRKTGLRSLSAFRNLREVSDNFQIFQNPHLTSFEGLDNLERVSLMSAMQNDGLDSAAGMPKLRSVDSYLSITFGSEVASLEGFPSVQGEDTEIRIAGRFADLSPLSVTDVGGYTISSPVLESLEGLPRRPSFDKLFVVGGVFHDLAPLRGVNSIGSLDLGQTNLRTLEGLEDLGSVGAFTIYDNDRLENVRALGSLTSVESTLQFQGNGALQSLEGLEHVESIGRLEVRASDSLTSLEPLLEGALASLGSLRVTFNEGIPACEAELLCSRAGAEFCEITGNADGSSTLCD